jgi:hypothetical protein
VKHPLNQPSDRADRVFQQNRPRAALTERLQTTWRGASRVVRGIDIRSRYWDKLPGGYRRLFLTLLQCSSLPQVWCMLLESRKDFAVEVEVRGIGHLLGYAYLPATAATLLEPEKLTVEQ